MTKVMFDSEKNEYYEGAENGMVPITQTECYKFVNSLGVKCIGSENGYAVYVKSK